jgi:cytochrome c biogenesis protein CcmG, thiol:disulfide interchange protein DsbE
MKKRFSVFLLCALLLAIVAVVPGCKSRSAKASGDDTGKSNDTAKSKLKDEPQVTFKALDGKDLELSSLKGKVVVVNFWATWCEPCRTEIPWMISFQQKYADKGFTLLGVAMDDEGKSVVEPFVQKTQFDVDGHSLTMNYPIVLGSDAIADKFGGLIGLPTTVVISRDGKIAKRFIGLASHDELQKEIESLL